MKKIKLFSMFTIILVGLFFMTGCGQKNVEGTLEEIMTKLYAEIPENERPMMLMNTDLTEMDKETISGFIGTADIDFKQILASESAVGSIAHSVVLVRMNEKADVTAAAEAIKAKVNPRKWVCVGVAPEDVIVEVKGDLIVLIMIEDKNSREKIYTAFDAL
ncbi:MAG: hypothetical protein IJ966_04645 [Bacilli bacterium]|nr:hypothetical protein [Bacilli bacterium]